MAQWLHENDYVFEHEIIPLGYSCISLNFYALNQTLCKFLKRQRSIKTATTKGSKPQVCSCTLYHLTEFQYLSMISILWTPYQLVLCFSHKLCRSHQKGSRPEEVLCLVFNSTETHQSCTVAHYTRLHSCTCIVDSLKVSWNTDLRSHTDLDYMDLQSDNGGWGKTI